MDSFRIKFIPHLRNNVNMHKKLGKQIHYLAIFAQKKASTALPKLGIHNKILLNHN